MSFIIRDAVIEEVPKITTVYGEAVDNGTATYELTAPDLDLVVSRKKPLRLGWRLEAFNYLLTFACKPM